MIVILSAIDCELSANIYELFTNNYELSAYDCDLISNHWELLTDDWPV